MFKESLSLVRLTRDPRFRIGELPVASVIVLVAHSHAAIAETCHASARHQFGALIGGAAGRGAHIRGAGHWVDECDIHAVDVHPVAVGVRARLVERLHAAHRAEDVLCLSGAEAVARQAIRVAQQTET